MLDLDAVRKACEAVYRWISRTAAGILGRDFSNLSRVERDEAADRARYRIAEAMTLGRIAAVSAGNNWPIIAYVRALQYSRHAPAADLPAELRKKLSSNSSPAGAEKAAGEAEK